MGIMMLSRLRVVAMFVFVLGMLLSLRPPARAIPAFARKYDLPCSACHEAWPKLNDFGIAFRDRGYQLGNEKDSRFGRTRATGRSRCESNRNGTERAVATK